MEKFDFLNFDKKQFESKDRFEENSEMQQILSKRVLEFVSEESMSIPSKLDFFFYTDTKEKAEGLSNDLKKLNYDFEISGSENNQWAIIGCTNEIMMNEGYIEKWVENMCELGFQNDCGFDGWGTFSGEL